LMQQYREIKARHPDAILFFRMGDFYEMFEDAAQLAARELGLTLTSRNNGGAADVPLAGVPVKAATDYLRRLIAQGHRVAICEQVEDPKLAKGLVRREVVETVTPGTVLADEWLERRPNNCLLAFDARGTPAGLAALDLTTGELLLETAAAEELPAVLARYEAPEVVVPAGMVLAVAGAARTEREAWEFDPELAREDLTRAFRVASLDGLGVEPEDRPALGAAGALLRYARELKPGGLPHVARPRIVRRGDLLPLDEMTRRNLELVEPLRVEPGRKGTTLLDVLGALDGLEARGRAALLEQAADGFDLLQDLGEELGRALVERPPAQASDGDAVRAGYDRELDELKDARDGGKHYIAGLQARERERTGIGSLKVGFNKVFGYYIEVTNPHRDRVPPDYERRQTLTGAERYVTPELKQYEAKV